MSAKNVDHELVREALIAEGWTITDDPLHVSIGFRDIFVDLGIERPIIGAERGPEKIAVEIQSFLSDSALTDFHHAVGQYVVYRSILNYHGIDRRLYMAIPKQAFATIWSELIGSVVRTENKISLLVYYQKTGAAKWIEHNNIVPS